MEEIVVGRGGRGATGRGGGGVSGRRGDDRFPVLAGQHRGAVVFEVCAEVRNTHGIVDVRWHHVALYAFLLYIWKEARML